MSSTSTIGLVAVTVFALIGVTLACPSKLRPPAATPRPTPRPTTPPPTQRPPATANIFFMTASLGDPGMTVIVSWFDATEECQSVGLRLPSSIPTKMKERITEFLSSLPADYPDSLQLWRGTASNESETTCRSVARTRGANETGVDFERLQGCSDSLHGFICEGSINLSNATNMGLIRCTGACALCFE